MLVPLVVGISYAFRDVQILNPFSGGFVGLDHFRELAGDKAFLCGALVNTFWWTFLTVLIQLVLGLVLALLLDVPFRGRGLAQALVFLPWAVPTFLTGLNWAWLFNPTIGPFPTGFTPSASSPRPTTSSPTPTSRSGSDHRGGLVGHPLLRDHAARRAPVDPLRLRGGGHRRRQPLAALPFDHPSFLAPVIAITVLLRTVWVANFTDLIIVMTGGGPADRTQTVASYIFTQAFKRSTSPTPAISLVLLALPRLRAPDPAPPPALIDRDGEEFMRALGTVAHRLAILAYIAFALFLLTGW